MTVQYSNPANEIHAYATGVLGFNPNIRTSYADHKPGTVSFGTQATRWIYVQASGAVAVGTCTVTVTGTGAAATFVVTDTAGLHTATAAFADGEWGWVYQTADEVA